MYSFRLWNLFCVLCNFWHHRQVGEDELKWGKYDNDLETSGPTSFNFIYIGEIICDDLRARLFPQSSSPTLGVFEVECWDCKPDIKTL